MATHSLPRPSAAAFFMLRPKQYWRLLRHMDNRMVGLTGTTPQATPHTLGQLALGRDPIDVERPGIGSMRHTSMETGATRCAISAIDVALWDLLGQQAGLPMRAAANSIRVYNTCAGTLYARGIHGVVRIGSARTAEGDYEDLDAFLNQADRELARDLLSEGIRAMKIWPFDAFASDGTYISFNFDAKEDLSRKSATQLGWIWRS